MINFVYIKIRIKRHGVVTPNRQSPHPKVYHDQIAGSKHSFGVHKLAMCVMKKQNLVYKLPLPLYAMIVLAQWNPAHRCTACPYAMSVTSGHAQ